MRFWLLLLSVCAIIDQVLSLTCDGEKCNDRNDGMMIGTPICATLSFIVQTGEHVVSKKKRFCQTAENCAFSRLNVCEKMKETDNINIHIKQCHVDCGDEAIDKALLNNDVLRHPLQTMRCGQLKCDRSRDNTCVRVSYEVRNGEDNKNINEFMCGDRRICEEKRTAFCVKAGEIKHENEGLIVQRCRVDCNSTGVVPGDSNEVGGETGELENSSTAAIITEPPVEQLVCAGKQCIPPSNMVVFDTCIVAKYRNLMDGHTRRTVECGNFMQCETNKDMICEALLASLNGTSENCELDCNGELLTVAPPLTVPKPSHPSEMTTSLKGARSGQTTSKDVTSRAVRDRSWISSTPTAAAVTIRSAEEKTKDATDSCENCQHGTEVPISACVRTWSSIATTLVMISLAILFG